MPTKDAPPFMLVLHANFSGGMLRLWAESGQHVRPVRTDDIDASIDDAVDVDAPSPDDDAAPSGPTAADPNEEGAASTAPVATPAVDTADDDASAALVHPTAASPTVLRDHVSRLASGVPGGLDAPLTVGVICLRLPTASGQPVPSPRLAAALGLDVVDDPDGLAMFETPCLVIPPEHALPLLLAIERDADADAPDDDDRQLSDGGLIYSHSVRYWSAVAQFVADLLVDQRFVPTLVQGRDGHTRGRWQPWLQDEHARRHVEQLLSAMPAVVRAVVDEADHQAWPILEGAIVQMADATVRRVLEAQDFSGAIESRDPSEDPNVRWLAGLLGRDDVVSDGTDAIDMLHNVRRWMARLHDDDDTRPFRLGLKLNEPEAKDDDGADASADAGSRMWTLKLFLVSGDGELVLDADDLWVAASHNGAGQDRHESQELLLRELGRAAEIYPQLEDALSEATPTGLTLTTSEAYTFLREYREVLAESGFAVTVPTWWDDPDQQLGARLRISSDDLPDDQAAGAIAAAGPSMLGLQSLVQYEWQLAIGDQELSLEAFRELVRRGEPLVRFGDTWIEIRPEQARALKSFLDEHPGGEIEAIDAIRLAFNIGEETAGVPVLGLSAQGWIGRLFEVGDESSRVDMVDQPRGFKGTMRPYQLSGLSWLAFLERIGLGGCLADDMGLGKTIQLIGLLLHEREIIEATPNAPAPGPTLLVVPTSVISNWQRELDRFSPSLTYHVHHGLDRPIGDSFARIAAERDLVITTYALVSRDRETLERVHWHRVVLDEAQYIKNPPTKQTTAIRALRAQRRIALTGTPVENRLSELWSIMDFCNPGYLGPRTEFRRRFAMPIERRRDQVQASRLRRLVRPMVLRRLKTDPNVITDLPECVETRAYATLTAEQAKLYQQVVDQLLGRVELAEGMQRRGLVLATLMKLKQICNHPAQLLRAAAARAERQANAQAKNAAEAGEQDIEPAVDLPAALEPERDLSPEPARSGKCRRLVDMLEEVLAEGDSALIFTQFRQMGHLLSTIIERELDCNALFLHGGTPQGKRQDMIDRFQARDGRHPIFLLSLKAGGLGLNLTAANHVFHFDRWWNPAVEKQATDRAFRIGQSRTVHVHKFVCVGTIEERIDQMIEAKTELADQIIGSGEDWLTEMSTTELRDLMTLRQSAMEVDS